MDDLVAEALRFLRGTKTSESMSPGLRDALYIPIRFSDDQTLDAVLSDQLLAGRDVIVSGTAGGGKTALVERVISHLLMAGRTVCIVDSLQNPTDADTDGATLVVKDLTATGSSVVSELWNRSGRSPMLIAGNEGALLDPDWGQQMDAVVDDLRELQVGGSPADPSRPVVVDMAALDPISHGLPGILSNPTIRAAVELWEYERGAQSDSPRLIALRQLDFERVRRAVAHHIRRALGPGEITYRELWNFVADLLLEGDNSSVPPTSTWFWRLFYGDNSLSWQLSESAKPNFLSLPEVSMALYRGDLSALGLTAEALVCWTPAGCNAIDAPDEQAAALVRWNRIQYVVLDAWCSGTQASPFIGLRQDDRASGFKTADLVGLMNGFFHRNRPTPGHGLELWVDLGVERKEERPPAIVSLGVVSLSQLKVVPSSVLANVADRQMNGARWFLRAEGARGAATSIEITSSLINGLLRGRSTRTYHRSVDEVDLALKRFYFGCARVCSMEEPAVLEVLHSKEEGESYTIRWRVDGLIHRLGAASVY